MKLGENIYYFEKLSSTNTYATENASILPDGSVIIADFQSSGKGRLGRSWTAQPGQAVCMSFFFKEPKWNISLLPIISAVAAAKAVEAVAGTQLGIKWPNDLVLNRKKICGILCESVILGKAKCAVSGIGINVNQKKKDFSQEMLPHATSLALECCTEFSVEDIQKALIASFEETLKLWAEYGFSDIKDFYTKRLVNLGREVRIVYKNNTKHAKALGIADNGNLLCELPNGNVIKINSGETSVRGLYGYI